MYENAFISENVFKNKNLRSSKNISLGPLEIYEDEQIV